MDALIGRFAVVVEDIPASGLGRVKLDGDNWQAKCAGGLAAASSQRVEVVDYDSIILIVKPIEN
jgi:membrane protein implicated in regulation of membrane protease activity